jgi:hypothetical protein
MNTIRREFWNGPSEELRELFTLTRHTGAKARCALWRIRLAGKFD